MFDHKVNIVMQMVMLFWTLTEWLTNPILHPGSTKRGTQVRRKQQHLTFRHLPNYHLHIRLILRRGKALKLNFLYWSSLIFACWAKLKRQNISIFSISNLGWHVPHFVSAPICYKFKFSDSKLPHNTMSHHIKSHYKAKSTTMRWRCKMHISGEGVP